MPHFSAESIRFLAELRDNNDRDWFAANKARYERELKLPAEIFRDEMVAALERMLGAPVAAKIFRIHRDVRFSKDKTPYNAHLRIGFYRGGGAPGKGAGFFFSLEPDRAIAGAGAFAFSAQGLDRYRADLLDDGRGPELAALVEGLVARGYRLDEPELKRVPAGAAQDHPRQDLLRRKGIALWRDFADPAAVTGPEGVAACMDVFAELRPLGDAIAGYCR